MTAENIKKSLESNSGSNSIFRQEVLGSRRLSNYLTAIVLSLGGTGFLLAGISSYLHINLMPFTEATKLIFIPQGIVMGFYGTAALALALYQWILVIWDVGSGYNEFNRDTGEACILRRGFPGKNKTIELRYPLSELQSVRVDIREGLNPRRSLFLRVKGKGEIRLTRIGQPLSLSELENQGAALARFLTLPVEGL
ncbi:MAG: photosystem I assembly protein Ycf4 [Cyanobacteria bacterium WB6_1B_304]|nr:photosystem I assembly protein Ycf4 [Cyanobacteria bacterium WB6_1B_304]